MRKGLLQAGLGPWREKGSEDQEKLDGGDCNRFTQQVLELPHSLGTALPKAQTHWIEDTGGPTASQAPSAGEASKLESSLCSPRFWFFLLPPPFHIHPQRVLVSCLGLQAWGMWQNSDGDTEAQAIMSQGHLRSHYSSKSDNTY